jgi:hypothetical protein
VSAYLRWGILEFATFLCMRVSANLRWGNLGFATFYVYGCVQTANLKWETSDLQHVVCVFVCCQLQAWNGKFRVCNILCMYMGGYKTTSLKWETLDFQHFLCMCVCMCVANFKLEMGNLGFATFYVCIWVGTKLQALKWETLDFQHFVCVCVCCQLQTWNGKFRVCNI